MRRRRQEGFSPEYLEAATAAVERRLLKARVAGNSRRVRVLELDRFVLNGIATVLSPDPRTSPRS
jgi:hypothetical protein